MVDLSWITFLFAETSGLPVFDFCIDTLKLVRCCVRKDAENSDCELTAILKFYPTSSRKTLRSTALFSK
jgi:hypothetical protein